MDRWDQVVGEKRLYQVSVEGDTISSADWSCDKADGQVVRVLVSDTVTQALFSSGVPGTYVITASMAMASGQQGKGQARVDVLGRKV